LEIKPDGEIISKNIIDSSKDNFYSRPWFYGESGMVRLPDGGWVFAYAEVVPAGYSFKWLAKTTKEGKRAWKRTIRS